MNALKKWFQSLFGQKEEQNRAAVWVYTPNALKDFCDAFDNRFRRK